MQPLPTPPYYAVIFRSELTEDTAGYGTTAQQMESLASKQPGYLGFYSSREGNVGTTISYWQDEAAIAAWRGQAEHLLAQQAGRERWYLRYTVEVSQVQRNYAFPQDS